MGCLSLWMDCLGHSFANSWTKSSPLSSIETCTKQSRVQLHIHYEKREGISKETRFDFKLWKKGHTYII